MAGTARQDETNAILWRACGISRGTCRGGRAPHQAVPFWREYSLTVGRGELLTCCCWEMQIRQELAQRLLTGEVRA